MTQQPEAGEIFYTQVSKQFLHLNYQPGSNSGNREALFDEKMRGIGDHEVVESSSNKILSVMIITQFSINFIAYSTVEYKSNFKLTDSIDTQYRNRLHQ